MHSRNYNSFDEIAETAVREKNAIVKEPIPINVVPVVSWVIAVQSVM
jgi:hypothetical protein